MYKVIKKRYGHPDTPEQGLEKNKNWYEYQLIEHTQYNCSEEQYNELIILVVCEYGGTMEVNDRFTILSHGETEYLIEKWA